MALSIRNPETEALARDVARIMGISITEAITDSLRERAKTLAPLRARQSKVQQARDTALDRVVAKFGKGIKDPRSADDIIGYDEHGLPR
jgi:antitoxin VapB